MSNNNYVIVVSLFTSTSIV